MRPFNTPARRPARPAAAGSSLFDGKNLDHWHGDGTATFKIEDGSVIATDKKDPKAVAAYLVSKESYKDFELRAEFWVSDDANSGIFSALRPEEDRRQDLLRVQHLRQAARSELRHRLDRLHRRGDPMPKAGGKWNTMEITAPRAGSSRSMFNGKKTVDVRNGLFDEGHIALQFGVGTVKFRKIEIKEL